MLHVGSGHRSVEMISRNVHYAGAEVVRFWSGDSHFSVRKSAPGQGMVSGEEGSMSPILSWHFGPFRLDLATASLWRGDQLLPLPPKPLAVLVYLVAHAGHVVTKAAVLEAVWPDAMVTEGVLKTCLGQIRQALGERAKTPRYIAT